MEQTLPDHLRQKVGSEQIEFVVKSKRDKPLSKALSQLVFGVIWSGFVSIFVFAFFGPLLRGEEVHFTSNGTPVTAGPGNMGELLFPGILIGVFVIVGIVMLIGGLYMLIKPGGWFVGTPERLYLLKGHSMRSIDWEQFSGDITVRGSESKGTITLGLRTGEMVSSKNSGQRYVPHTLYLASIPRPYEIERTIRQRIEQHDPTPSSE